MTPALEAALLDAILALLDDAAPTLPNRNAMRARIVQEMDRTQTAAVLALRSSCLSLYKSSFHGFPEK